MVVVMCTPPAVRMWSIEMAVLYRLNLTANRAPGEKVHRLLKFIVDTLVLTIT